MNRTAAVQFLHDRHPLVIDAPEQDVDLGSLHLEVLWFQGHTCDLIDERAESALRRCFETIHHLLVQGDHEVKTAVCEHYVIPHLVFQHDLAWAMTRMPPLLAELCDMARQRA